ncbi:hypothetical protein [Paenibacillus macquariensis]|uniref:hypothetical protein n=1 Tax=Paenibacillus macquariensis TaxID=948756 RepID=UPI000B305C07|nr:hypothetical protein [Paenibacillus macquariensis]MEC0092035.1 hypothetical protein [Paenibacillus macquariensis]
MDGVAREFTAEEARKQASIEAVDFFVYDQILYLNAFTNMHKYIEHTLSGGGIDPILYKAMDENRVK